MVRFLQDDRTPVQQTELTAGERDELYNTILNRDMDNLVACYRRLASFTDPVVHRQVLEIAAMDACELDSAIACAALEFISSRLATDSEYADFFLSRLNYESICAQCAGELSNAYCEFLCIFFKISPRMLGFGFEKGIFQALSETRDCQFDENPHQVALNIRLMLTIGEAIIYFRMPGPNIITEAFFNRLMRLVKSGLIPEESEPAVLRLSFVCILGSFNEFSENFAAVMILNGVFDILLTYFDRDSYERCHNLGVLLYALVWMMADDPTIRRELQDRQFHIWVLRRVEMKWDDLSGLYLAILAFLCSVFDECGNDIVDSGFIAKLRELLLSGSYLLKRGAASIIGSLTGMIGSSKSVAGYFENEKELVEDMIQLVVDSGGNEVWLVRLMMCVEDVLSKIESSANERCRELLTSLANEQGSEVGSVGCIAEAISKRLNERPDPVE
jgi:hypothetical protein